MTTRTVTITRLAHPDDLFRHYDGQTMRQPAYLGLDLETGQMWATYNPEIGNAIPVTVYFGRQIRVTIPALTDTAANRLLEDAVPIAQRIVDGSVVEWDHRRGAKVGRLDEAADAALGELTAMCDPAQFSDNEIVSEYSAGEWFGAMGRDAVLDWLGITADTTDEQIADCAREEAINAHNAGDAGYVVLTGAEEYLKGLRDELRQEVRDALADVASEIEKLTNRRDQLIRRIRAWDVDSDRAIAALAGGISHTTVQNIAKATEDA